MRFWQAGAGTNALLERCRKAEQEVEVLSGGTFTVRCLVALFNIEKMKKG